MTDPVANDAETRINEAQAQADVIKDQAIKEARQLRSEMVGLGNEMKGLAEEMKGLRAYGLRNRKLIRVTIASVVLDVLLSLGLGFVGVKALGASHDAVSAKAANKNTCLASNEARANNRELWHHILDISTPPHQTPEQKKQQDDFRDFVDMTFAPRDCEHLT